jgi:hypothetical protein
VESRICQRVFKQDLHRLPVAGDNANADQPRSARDPLANRAEHQIHHTHDDPHAQRLIKPQPIVDLEHELDQQRAERQQEKHEAGASQHGRDRECDAAAAQRRALIRESQGQRAREIGGAVGSQAGERRSRHCVAAGRENQQQKLRHAVRELPARELAFEKGAEGEGAERGEQQPHDARHYLAQDHEVRMLAKGLTLP